MQYQTPWGIITILGMRNKIGATSLSFTIILFIQQLVKSINLIQSKYFSPIRKVESTPK